MNDKSEKVNHESISNIDPTFYIGLIYFDGIKKG